MPVTPYCKKKELHVYQGLPIFLKYLSSLFIDLKIMKKTGKNTLLKLEGPKNLAQSDELRTVNNTQKDIRVILPHHFLHCI